MSRLLLCTDLDRTLLPNGSEPESEQARKKFSQLAEHPGLRHWPSSATGGAGHQAGTDQSSG